MKIAVTYENGQVFQHFGHCENFKIYDVNDGMITDSQVVSAAGSGHGALAGFLKAHGADTLICGGIGGGARTALAQAGIQLYPGVTGSTEQAVQALRRRMEPSQEERAPAIPGLKKGDKSKYVLQAMGYIGEHYGDPNITVAEIAQSIGISEGHLSHVFKKETSYTALGYLTLYRIHMARRLLADCRYKVYEVAGMVGYRDVAYFGSTFKKLTGLSPSEYQDRCR